MWTRRITSKPGPSLWRWRFTRTNASTSLCPSYPQLRCQQLQVRNFSAVTMPFGMFKGKPLNDIPTYYVDWLFRERVLDGFPELKLLFKNSGHGGEFVDAEMVDPQSQSMSQKMNRLSSHPQHLSSAAASHLQQQPLISLDANKVFSPELTPGVSGVGGDISADPSAPSQFELDSKAQFGDGVIDEYAANIIFIDVEAVHTTKIADIEHNHIVQFGAVDGLGRNLSIDICPAVDWDQINHEGGFFEAHNFQRFFPRVRATASSQDFLHTWPKIRDWIFRGPGRKKGPIVLVGHNIISYDIPLLKKELGPLHRDLLNPDVMLFDTLKMLREWRRSTIPRKHKNDLKLSSLYERYTGHSINNHHSAMEDACAVKRVVQEDSDGILQTQLRNLILRNTNIQEPQRDATSSSVSSSGPSIASPTNPNNPSLSTPATSTSHTSPQLDIPPPDIHTSPIPHSSSQPSSNSISDINQTKLRSRISTPESKVAGPSSKLSKGKGRRHLLVWSLWTSPNQSESESDHMSEALSLNSSSEVATSLGIKEDTVRSHLVRAARELEQQHVLFQRFEITEEMVEEFSQVFVEFRCDLRMTTPRLKLDYSREQRYVLRDWYKSA